MPSITKINVITSQFITQCKGDIQVRALKQQKSLCLTHDVQKSICAVTRRATVLINFVVHVILVNLE